ncbi:MAG: type II secretion system protein [Eubacteriales bacterium]
MNNEKGMSLNELMAVVAILAIMGMIFIQFLFTSTDIFQRQQIANEQTIIMDHIRRVITSEVRYVETMTLDNRTDPAYVEYSSIASTGNTLMFQENQSEVAIDLTSPEIMGSHTMEVQFEKVTGASDVLQVKVFLDTGTNSELEQTFSIRLLNMALYVDNRIEDMGDGSRENINKIFFKDDVDP